MKRTKKTLKTRTPGANDDVKSPETKTASPSPTETAFRPRTPLELRVTIALDQELEWYFSYAESALRRDRVGMLPSYATLLLAEPTDVAIRNRAGEIARIARGCLLSMRPRHAEVLRAVYTPRAWPKNVYKAFEDLSAVVVRLAFADDPWPQRSARAGLEQASAIRLSAALTSKSVSAARLKNQAQRLFGGAIGAYAGLRALEGSSLGGG
jgi:hypothetical protein